MTAPPEKKESNEISLFVGEWKNGQYEQFSPVYRINGYSFRLRLKRIREVMEVTDDTEIYLLCDYEAALWTCALTVTALQPEQSPVMTKLEFASWQNGRWGKPIGAFKVGADVQFTILTKDDANVWRLPPPPDSIKSPDAIFVIGEDKKEIEVNKEFLASQSPYFERLFFGYFKETTMDKIPIGGVEYEEFCNIIKLVYGSSEDLLTDENVLRVLELADRFELKIVEHRVISYLLSPYSFSRSQKLLLFQEKNLPLFKTFFLETISTFGLRNVQNSPEFADFSDALKAEINDRMVDLSVEEN